MEATPEQAAEGVAIVRVLAAVLDRLVNANAHIARADPGQVTKFHAMKAPGISILQYLERYVLAAWCPFCRQPMSPIIIYMVFSVSQDPQVRLMLKRVLHLVLDLH